MDESTVMQQESLLVKHGDLISLRVKLATERAEREGLAERQYVLTRLKLISPGELEPAIEALKARISEDEDKYRELCAEVAALKTIVFAEQIATT